MCGTVGMYRTFETMWLCGGLIYRCRWKSLVWLIEVIEVVSLLKSKLRLLLDL
jgi:hypothetical protein